MRYGFPPLDGVDPSSSGHTDADHFIEDRQQIRADARDALGLAQARIAPYFDEKHEQIRIGEWVMKLAAGIKPEYRLPNMSTLDVKKSDHLRLSRK